ncbi:aspartate/glutamate racemase family protein [Geodermatophilus sp. CPCC 206100]|uniref:maleate cis-trans isomerase family protein n=1 Tax=Geodermatophilus sp. CPCC 206100 TaxID=3020054 RepID=UPI003B00EC71
MSLGFGTVARVGHLYPSGGLCDYELQLMAPDGVQFVTTRLPFARTGLADDRRLLADLEDHARLVADADVALVAVNCTAATMLTGPDVIRRRVREATGLPSTTTIEAVLAALRAAGIRRPALITPYPDDVVAAETAFLAAQGVDVARHAGIPCRTPVEQAGIEPSAWLEIARSLAGRDTPPVDGVLLSCAGVRVAPVIDPIERELGVPVVASNQALLWQVLRTLGVPARPRSHGRLLAGDFDDADPALPIPATRRLQWTTR